MKNSSLSYFVYLRKSSDEKGRQVRSIGDQWTEIKRFAEREGIRIVKVFEESRSAKHPGRPVFNDMLARINAGEANAILAWHANRLARNRHDGATVIDLIDDGHLKSIALVIGWFEPTPQGKHDLLVAFADSELYVANLSIDVMRGYRLKAEDGLWPARPPFGYIHDERSKGIVPVPSVARLIRRVFKRYAKGDLTLTAMHELATQWGLQTRFGKQLALGMFCRMLSHHVFRGMVKYNGQLYRGRHDPIVTLELYEQVQAVLQLKGKPRRRKKNQSPHPCLGLFRCGECGAAVTSEVQKGHRYFRCSKKLGSCSQRYVREEELVWQVREAIWKVSMPDEFATTLLATIDRECERFDAESRKRCRLLREDLRVVEVKMSRLMDSYLEEVIDVDEYVKLKNPLVTKQREIDHKIRKIDGKPNHFLELARTFVMCCNQATKLAIAGNLKDQIHFLRKIGSNHQIRDRRMIFSPLGHWETVTQQGPNGDRARSALSADTEIGRGLLQCAALDRLLEPVLEQTPLLSLTASDDTIDGGSVKPSTHPSTRLEGLAPTPALC